MAFIPPLPAAGQALNNHILGLSEFSQSRDQSALSGLISNQSTNVRGLGTTNYAPNPTPQDTVPMEYRTQEGVQAAWGGEIANVIVTRIVQDLISTDNPILRLVFQVRSAEHGAKFELDEIKFEPGVAQLNPDLGISSLLANRRDRIKFGMDRYSIGAFEGMWYAMTQESKSTLQFRIAQLRDSFVRALLIRCYRELSRVRHENDIWPLNGIQPPRDDASLEAALVNLNINVARMFGIFGKDPDRAFTQVRVAAERALEARGCVFNALVVPTTIKEFGRGTPASMESAVLGEQRAALGYKGVGPVNDITQGVKLIPYDRIRVGPDASNVIVQGQNTRTFGSHVVIGNLDAIRNIRRERYSRGLQDTRAFDLDRGVHQVVPYMQVLERSNLFNAAAPAAVHQNPFPAAGLRGLGVWGAAFMNGLVQTNLALHPDTRARCPVPAMGAAALCVQTFGQYLDAIGYSDVIASYFGAANIGGGSAPRTEADFIAAVPYPFDAGSPRDLVGLAPAAILARLRTTHIEGFSLNFWKVWASFDIPVPFSFVLARFGIRAIMSSPIALDISQPVGIALASALTTTNVTEYRQATSTQIIGSMGVGVTRPDAIQPMYNAVPVQYLGGGSLRMYTNNNAGSVTAFNARANSHTIEQASPDAMVIPSVPDEILAITQTRVMALSWPTLGFVANANRAVRYSSSVPFMAHFARVTYAPRIHSFAINTMIRGVNSMLDAHPFNVVTWQGYQNHASPTDAGTITYHGPDSTVRDLWLGEPQQDEITNIFSGAGGSVSRVVATTSNA